MNRIGVAYESLTGRRGHNEDKVVVEYVPQRGMLVVVADGMGGHSAGEVASRIACEQVPRALSRGLSLLEAVGEANRVVYEDAAGRPKRQGMGTTVVAVLIGDDGTYTIANVGDSRAYRIDGSGVQQVTTDHSFVQEAVAQGKMSREEAERSSWRNSLTRNIGSEPEVDVDLFGPFAASPGHFLVLCSDGVTGTVGSGLIADVVRQTTDVVEAVQVLTRVALSRGSDDNVSAAILEFGDFQREPRTLTLPLTGVPQVEEDCSQSLVDEGGSTSDGGRVGPGVDGDKSRKGGLSVLGAASFGFIMLILGMAVGSLFPLGLVAPNDSAESSPILNETNGLVGGPEESAYQVDAEIPNLGLDPVVLDTIKP